MLDLRDDFMIQRIRSAMSGRAVPPLELISARAGEEAVRGAVVNPSPQVEGRAPHADVPSVPSAADGRHLLVPADDDEAEDEKAREDVLNEEEEDGLDDEVDVGLLQTSLADGVGPALQRLSAL